MAQFVQQQCHRLAATLPIRCQRRATSAAPWCTSLKALCRAAEAESFGNKVPWWHLTTWHKRHRFIDLLIHAMHWTFTARLATKAMSDLFVVARNNNELHTGTHPLEGLIFCWNTDALEIVQWTVALPGVASKPLPGLSDVRLRRSRKLNWHSSWCRLRLQPIAYKISDFQALTTCLLRSSWRRRVLRWGEKGKQGPTGNPWGNNTSFFDPAAVMTVPFSVGINHLRHPKANLLTSRLHPRALPLLLGA